MMHDPARPALRIRLRCRDAAAAVLLAALPAGSFAQPADFRRDVLPVLTANCFACHGPNASKRKAGLRLDDRAVALKKGAIVPGKPAGSELVARVTAADGGGRMPPPKAGPRLSPGQVQALRQWIEQGAPYAGHWAFVPPRRPEPPRVGEAGWPRTPIDNFILARQY